MNKDNEIHIGKIINTVFIARGISITEFAKQLNCERPNVYNIFKRKNIDVNLLIKISHILNYDFIQEIYVKNNSYDAQANPFKITYQFEIAPENYKSFLNTIKKMEKLGIVYHKDSPSSQIEEKQLK